MEKKKIGDDIRNEILNKFKNGVKLRQLERDYKEYGCSFFYIQNLCKSNGDIYERLEESYPLKTGYVLKAVCKLTGKKINDYKNESGAIYSHLKSLYPEISKQSQFQRRQIQFKTNKFWYDNYFDFIYEEIKEEKKCPYCDWFTYDVNNVAGSFQIHLKNNHNKLIQEYLIDYPNDTNYFKQKILNEDNSVECKICNKRFEILNSKHLNTHGISVGDYKLKYDDYKIVSNKLSTDLKNRYYSKEGLNNKSFKNISNVEKEIQNHLSDKIDIEICDRKLLNGLECDIINHDKKICIEVNGVKHHTEIFGKKNKNYHLNKTDIANSKGYSMIHIFDDEIILNRKIVLSKLSHIFNINNSNNKIVFARKCEIKKMNVETESAIIKKFLIDNHIQGYAQITHCYGAYFDNNLISVMCFNNKRQMNKTNTHTEKYYELTRFCVKLDYIVTGIASRLLKKFIEFEKPENIVSFADKRWTLNKDNNLYTKLGFKLTETLKPDYYYYNEKFDRVKRFHKFSFGKSSIKRKFPQIFDKNKTEWAMMQELGFDRIWDCGKFKYEISFSK